MSQKASNQGIQGFEYFSTHPSHEKRMQNMEKWLPEAQRRRENADCAQYKLDRFWKL
jgi:predicted Zn-dependent protease